ncbi:AAA family ATPase [Fructobacillus sp. M2-14]|uniref:AAA family ATPase n=1 Tax=Fructobacillus broussonetiae TaxID=2713173 RepID=A0ABS5QZX5_9LACO|nr:AAA family ATPase [Fructobacillus broussonetiae]MBS9338297.1 AAA family ATPase [Fructobacillus broussonetiae]
MTVKINQILISGFGKWSNVTFKDMQDWQVFFGHNEAGKSTLKDFVLGVFFGFPKAKKGAQLYEPRSGAKYGGSIDMECEKGAYRITRMGRVKTKLSVVEQKTGLELPNPEKFLEELFYPLTEEDFRQIYSFDETELSLVSKLAEDDLEQTLLSFTKPQAQRFLTWAKDKDEAASKDFGKTKTANRPLNIAIKEYEQLESKRQDKQSNLSEYLQASKSLSDQVHQLELSKQMVATKQSEWQHAKELQRAKEIYQQNHKTLAAADDANNTAGRDWRPAYDEALKLESDLNWIEEKIDENKKRLAEHQAHLQTADQKEQFQNLKSKSDALSHHLERVLTLNQELGEAEESFGGHIPEALSEHERQALEKSSSGVWPTVSAVVIAAFGFAFSFALGLVLSAVGLAVVGYFYQDRMRTKRILDRFGPLSKEEVLAKQDELKSLASKRDERREENDRERALTEGVLAAMSEAGFYDQAASLQMSSSQRILQAAQHYLAQEQSDGQSRQLDRVNEALDTQQTLYKKQRDTEKKLTDKLGEFGFKTIDEFKEFVSLQRQNQTAKDRAEVAREQLGEALWSEIEKLEQACEGSDEALNERLEADCIKAETALKESQQKQDALLAQVEKTRVQLNYLAGDETLAALDQKIENQNAYLKDAFTDYLAKRLLVPVVNQAFLGKQDSLSSDVLSQASAYLAQLSEGDYEAIQMEKEQLFVSGMASRFAIIELSSGAKDLVYLSLRLALATSLDLKERFPLLVDDAFVHLDDEKKERALALLQEIAMDQQVIFWTFDEKVGADHVVNLNAYS